MLTATDDAGNTASTAVSVTVEEGNATCNEAPIVANMIDNQMIEQAFGNRTIDLSNVFTDPENDGLTFFVSSSDVTIANVSVIGNTLTFTEGTAIGTTTITVIADDGNGNTTSTTFNITVSVFTALENSSFSRAVSLYPNPASKFVLVSSEKFVSKQANFYWSDNTGKRIEIPLKRHDSKTYHFDLEAIPTGIYLLLIEVDGELGVKRLSK